MPGGTLLDPAPDLPPLPSLDEQVERLLRLGLHQRAGLAASVLQDAVAGALAQQDQYVSETPLLAVDPSLLPASVLAPHLELAGKHGFVVEDMTDVDDFTAIEAVVPPSSPLYLVHGIERGDEMANWSPNEALPAIVGRGRTPLTLTEGILWLIQQPDVLVRNHTFMTIGSRLVKANGSVDARTPAIWISNGTGRDGASRRNAPKVGWCWAGNRHTWLGFASAASRTAVV
jgi:hypothetical protein